MEKTKLLFDRLQDDLEGLSQACPVLDLLQGDLLQDWLEARRCVPSVCDKFTLPYNNLDDFLNAQAVLCRFEKLQDITHQVLEQAELSLHEESHLQEVHTHPLQQEMMQVKGHLRSVIHQLHQALDEVMAQCSQQLAILVVTKDDASRLLNRFFLETMKKHMERVQYELTRHAQTGKEFSQDELTQKDWGRLWKEDYGQKLFPMEPEMEHMMTQTRMDNTLFSFTHAIMYEALLQLLTSKNSEKFFHRVLCDNLIVMNMHPKLGRKNAASYPVLLYPGEKILSMLPMELQTDKAIALLLLCQNEDWLDNAFLPTGKLGRWECALLANELSNELGIKHKWKVFESLWNIRGMSSDWNKAYGASSSCEFIDSVKKLILEYHQSLILH